MLSPPGSGGGGGGPVSRREEGEGEEGRGKEAISGECSPHPQQGSLPDKRLSFGTEQLEPSAPLRLPPRRLMRMRDKWQWLSLG